MEVKKVCVMGAGIMGGQIVQLMATNGYDVALVDIEDRFIENCLGIIQGNLKKYFVDKEKMTQEEANAIMGRIKGTTELAKAVDGTQLVIECIPEIMELKQDVFKQLDELCAPETILASNTSSYSITAIGSKTERQDRVIGMHFFNPVPVMKLIEIIRGAKTSDETVGVVNDVSVKCGKEVVMVNKDAPGFIVTRLFVVLSNEAVKLLEEGVASAEDIDKACQLGLGHTMGPLKSQDVVDGIEVALHSLEYYREEMGEAYRPAQTWKRMVLAGELGMKAGKGFYDYSQKQ